MIKLTNRNKCKQDIYNIHRSKVKLHVIQSIYLYILLKNLNFIFLHLLENHETFLLNGNIEIRIRKTECLQFFLQTLGNDEELKILLKHLNIFIFIFEIHGTP